MNKITLEEIGVGEIISYSSEEALRAVIQNGYSLRYVKKQTPEICLEAVKENGDSLQYVKDQTPEICLEAVKKYGEALRYVDDSIFFEEEKEEVTDIIELNGVKYKRIFYCNGKK